MIFFLFITWPEKKGVSVTRLYNGTFMSALEMAGFSITLLVLNDFLKQCLGKTCFFKKYLSYLFFFINGAWCISHSWPTGVVFWCRAAPRSHLPMQFLSSSFGWLPLHSFVGGSNFKMVVTRSPVSIIFLTMLFNCHAQKYFFKVYLTTMLGKVSHSIYLIAAVWFFSLYLYDSNAQ